MHNLTKIRIFRALLLLSRLPAFLLVYPLALLRKKLDTAHVFLFDRYAMGGAQRVHIDILQSIADQPKLVLFTRYSPNDGMKKAFHQVPQARFLDIHFWCDNLFFRLFSVHYWAFYLSRHRHLTILSSNSTFFYDLLPWLPARFRRIELLHNFTYGKKGMEFFGLANCRYLDRRLVVDHFTAQNIRSQYAANGIDASLLERVQVIEPGVWLPETLPAKTVAPLEVLYAGRGGAQKRVWLIDRIAKQCLSEGLPIRFHFAGDVDEEISEEVKAASVMHGRVADVEVMRRIYADSHVILLTSAYEGFPMFIKEGMAAGCIPVVTALPGNKTHLRSEQNALLIESVEDEDAVVQEGLQWLKRLSEDPVLRDRLSVAAFAYAQQHFSKEQFMAAYRALLTVSGEAS